MNVEERHTEQDIESFTRSLLELRRREIEMEITSIRSVVPGLPLRDGEKKRLRELYSEMQIATNRLNRLCRRTDLLQRTA